MITNTNNNNYTTHDLSESSWDRLEHLMRFLAMVAFRLQGYGLEAAPVTQRLWMESK